MKKTARNTSELIGILLNCEDETPIRIVRDTGAIIAEDTGNVIARISLLEEEEEEDEEPDSHWYARVDGRCMVLEEYRGDEPRFRIELALKNHENDEEISAATIRIGLWLVNWLNGEDPPAGTSGKLEAFVGDFLGGRVFAEMDDDVVLACATHNCDPWDTCEGWEKMFFTLYTNYGGESLEAGDYTDLFRYKEMLTSGRNS